MLILANNQRLDHVGVDVVQLNRELSNVSGELAQLTEKWESLAAQDDE